MKIDYNNYQIPNMRAFWSLQQNQTLESVKLIKSKNIHIFDDIESALYNLEYVYLFWYNVMFFCSQIEDEKKYTTRRFPDYPYGILRIKSHIEEKGEFEKTEDFEKRIKSGKDSDREVLKILYQDLSSLLHSEIKAFVSEQYNRVLKNISKNKVLSSEDYTLGNYNADKEELEITLHFRWPKKKFGPHDYLFGKKPHTFYWNSSRDGIFPFLMPEQEENRLNMKIAAIIPIEIAEKCVANIRRGEFELRGPLLLKSNGSLEEGKLEFTSKQSGGNWDLGEQLYTEIINTDFEYYTDNYIRNSLPNICISFKYANLKLIDLVTGKIFKTDYPGF